MSLSHVLAPDQIIFDLGATTRTGVITELVQVLGTKHIVHDYQAYVDVVLERENHATTGFGQGIAIPHGKSKLVSEAAVMIGKTREPVEWDSLDEQPVDLIFLLAIPEEAQGELHLQILSELAKKMLDEELIAKIRAETDPQAIIDLLE